MHFFTDIQPLIVKKVTFISSYPFQVSMQMVQEINVSTDKQWRRFHNTINNNVDNPHSMERFIIQYNLAEYNQFGDQLAPNIYLSTANDASGTIQPTLEDL